MNIKLYLIILFLVFATTASAQVKITTLTANQIPKSIKYSGKVVNAVRYADNLGDHFVVATETGIKQAKEEGFRDADIYAYHYSVTGNEFKITWQMHDFIRDCGVDVLANFLPKTLAVTDLNNDGTAEVWLMYKTVCHGDVSPSDMKIILHEGDKKYAVRGRTKVVVKGMAPEGGEYALDDAFKTGPGVFRKYAADLWKKNLLETWK